MKKLALSTPWCTVGIFFHPAPQMQRRRQSQRDDENKIHHCITVTQRAEFEKNCAV